jgi:hypothetical protein
MSTLARFLFVFGVVLTIGGIFLPWSREGDLISYYSPGIRIFPSIHDYGGFLVLFLSIAFVVLFIKPPDFIKMPEIWSIILGIALVIVSSFHIFKLLFSLASTTGVIGATTLQVGLIMVFIGSVVLLFIAVLRYLNFK